MRQNKRSNSFDDYICKIGEEYNKVKPPEIFELVVYDHIDILDPSEYGINLNKIDPATYYITSGDVIQKTKYLLKMIIELNNKVENIDFKKKIENNIEKTNRLIQLLLEARGKAIFFETEWLDNKLCLLVKNPRSKI